MIGGTSRANPCDDSERSQPKWDATSTQGTPRANSRCPGIPHTNPFVETLYPLSPGIKNKNANQILRALFVDGRGHNLLSLSEGGCRRRVRAMVRGRHKCIDEVAGMLGGAGLSSERLMQKIGDCQSQVRPALDCFVMAMGPSSPTQRACGGGGVGRGD